MVATGYKLLLNNADGCFWFLKILCSLLLMSGDISWDSLENQGFSHHYQDVSSQPNSRKTLIFKTRSVITSL